MIYISELSVICYSHRTKTMLGVGIALMILGLIFLIIDCWRICLYVFCIACLCKDPIELEEMDQRQNQNNETEDEPRVRVSSRLTNAQKKFFLIFTLTQN